MEIDASEARKTLHAYRAEAVNQLDELTRELHAVVAAAAGSNLDDEHDPEGATVAFEREQLAALRDRARLRLAEIDDALHRLEVGEYGICRHCHEIIRPSGSRRDRPPGSASAARAGSGESPHFVRRHSRRWLAQQPAPAPGRPLLVSVR